MSLKDKIYNKYYPITVINRMIARRKNNNKDFSLFIPDCMGGYIYHQLGLSFMSPTVSTMIKQTDFYKFITDIDKYINADFAEAKVSNGGYLKVN